MAHATKPATERGVFILEKVNLAILRRFATPLVRRGRLGTSPSHPLFCACAGLGSPFREQLEVRGVATMVAVRYVPRSYSWLKANTALN
jgi:hypothetical protein